MTTQPLTLLNDEEQMFRDAVAGYANEKIAPHVARMDERGELEKSLLPGLFELGVMGIEVPEDLGGAGSTFFTAALAVEALAEVDASFAVVIDVQNTLVNNALLRWGTDAQKKRYLTKLCKEWVGSYALSEPSSGSDAFALKCRAEKRGDKYILNGQKLWITNAAEANLYIVFANVDPS
jgi:alkylation response protein AidB-like acyl-CoA dehydrogenase